MNVVINTLAASAKSSQAVYYSKEEKQHCIHDVLMTRRFFLLKDSQTFSFLRHVILICQTPPKQTASIYLHFDQLSVLSPSYRRISTGGHDYLL